MPSRRHRSNTQRSNRYLAAIAIGILFIISLIQNIVEFFQANMWVLYTLIGIAVLIITFIIVNTIRKINAYKKTPYYLDTKTPWRKLRKPGMRFEADVYNEIAKRLPETKLLANALIPRVNVVNEYFEIDILLFSQKGVFALELKDWAGFIYGDTESDSWTVGKVKDKKRRAQSVYSPYQQNARHIEDLNQVYPHPYINHIIFSERGHIGQGMKEVSKLEGFFKRYHQLEDSLDIMSIEEHYLAIKSQLDSSKLPDHIERIKYNQVRYR